MLLGGRQAFGSAFVQPGDRLSGPSIVLQLGARLSF